MNLLANRRFPGLGAWFETGADDHEPLVAARTLAPLTRADGIDTCLVVVPGGHDFAVWRAAFASSPPWLTGRVGLTAPPGSWPPAAGACAAAGGQP